MDDFTKQAKAKYEGLVKQEGELKDQLTKLKEEQKPLEAYLQAAGVLELKKRGRKKAQPTE